VPRASEGFGGFVGEAETLLRILEAENSAKAHLYATHRGWNHNSKSVNKQLGIKRVDLVAFRNAGAHGLGTRRFDLDLMLL